MWRLARLFAIVSVGFSGVISPVQASVFYKFDIVAQSGFSSLVSIDQEISINETGRVAFIGYTTLNTSAFNSIWVGDGYGSPPRSINPSFNSSSRDFLSPQPDNGNLVVARERVAGAPANYHIGVWRTDTNDWNIYVSVTGGQLVSRPSISDDGFIAYVQSDTSGNSSVRLVGPGTSNSLASFTGSVALRPMVAKEGKVVFRDGGATTSPIVLMNGPAVTTIADSSEFSALGRSPGISSDGSVVTFYGVLAAPGPNTLTTVLGPGIFASFDDLSGSRKVIRVAGNPRELGFDDAGAALQLATFVPDTRVSVSRQPFGYGDGIENDTFEVCFLATPSAASRTNPMTGTPLLFSAAQGVWTVRVDIEPKLAGAAHALSYHPLSPLPVAQLNDNLGGQPITGLYVYNAVANAAADSNGFRTQRRGDHNVAFWASTASAQFAVRAAHLDSDGDGLLDHWETEGIDIDQDGIADLDLPGMGADPNKRDLFVEIDWLSDQPDHVHRPDAGVIQALVNVFGAAPALTGGYYGYRSDAGTPADIPVGITVHVDAGAGHDRAGAPLSVNMGTVPHQGGDWVGLPGNAPAHVDVVYFGTNGAFNVPGVPARSFDEIKRFFFGTADKRARELAFHYVLMADYHEGYPDNPGAIQGAITSGGINWFDSGTALPVDAAGDGLLKGHIVKLTGGRGAGQTRRIVINNESRVIIARNWTIPPNSTSTFVLLDGATGKGEVACEPFPDFNSRPGNDAVISLGGVGVTPRGYLGGSYLQWRTLVHELGHNLGLRHCGVDPDETRCIGTPNAYRSLMSYAHQATTPDSYTASGVVPVNGFSGLPDATFDDWGNLKMDFQNTFAFLGNSFDLSPGLVAAEPAREMTTADIILVNGGSLDLEPPTIKILSPIAGSVAALGSPLSVMLQVTDNTEVASVQLAFDVDGNGSSADPGETVPAIAGASNIYSATFTSLAGAEGVRSLIATALDTSMNLGIATSVVVVVGASCSYSIDYTNQSISAGGASGTIQLTASGSCPWQAQADADWIQILSATSGSGNGQVQFAVTSNYWASPRTGRITIAGQTLLINQAAGTCSFSLAPTAQSFTADEGAGSILVTASSGCPWTASTDADWISITSSPTGAGSSNVDFAVGINVNLLPRTGAIRVEDQLFTVFQAGAQVVAAPWLSVTLVDTNLVFNWPATYTGFRLEARPNLDSSSLWLPMTDQIIETNGQHQVTIPISGDRRFYRLSGP